MSGTRLILTNIKCPVCGREIHGDSRAFASEGEMLANTRALIAEHKPKCGQPTEPA